MTVLAPVQAAPVTLRDVTKTYGSGESAVHALRGVNLDIEGGEFAVVLGPSGSGKTTLLNLIGGIEAPTSGEIVVAGTRLNGHDPAQLAAFRRNHVGFVFQFFNLIPTLTARENVEVVMELTGRGDRREAPRLLESVGLGDRADHFPAQLSGGQQQRVAIARAIATQPGLLLCDEPTGALDLETGRTVLEVLQRLHREGRTVVVVSHNAAIAKLARVVVRMRSGTIDAVERNALQRDASTVEW